MWLFGAETAFFPCFFLPPPPSSGQAPLVHDPPPAAAPTSVEYPLEATTFVMWGFTFGRVSELAVAGGGRAFAYQGPPYFRYVCAPTSAWGCLRACVKMCLGGLSVGSSTLWCLEYRNRLCFPPGVYANFKAGFFRTGEVASAEQYAV